jgi:hypothetical protein
LGIALLATTGAGYIVYYDWQHREAQRALPKTAAVVRAPTSTPALTPSVSATPLPASLQLQTVPFTIQAPFQVWDKTHEEYCEAAAIYMVGQYLMKADTRVNIPPAEADAAMGRIVAWERNSFPGDLNLSLAQMIQVGAEFYPGIRGRVVPASLPAVEQQLAEGLPVILPVMTHGGPGGAKIYPTYGYENVYHVLVITGYDATLGRVYTNDSGLREGRYLDYAWPTLAVANQAQATTPRDESGAPVPTEQGTSMLVFSR